jgi:hypothetical protein
MSKRILDNILDHLPGTGQGQARTMPSPSLLIPRSSIFVLALSSDPSVSPSTGPSRINLSKLSPSAANDRLLSPIRLAGRLVTGPPNAVASLLARPRCGDLLMTAALLTLRFVGDVERCWLCSCSRCWDMRDG